MSRALQTLRSNNRHLLSSKINVQHKQLVLFRAYAASQQKPKSSTVHRGNAFEERSLNLLEQTMSMSLKRVGGKEDGGIDLLGWWWLPFDSDSKSNMATTFPSQGNENAMGEVLLETERRRRIRVIGQCKAEKKKMGPGYVRELEGVLYRLMATSSSSSSSSPLGLMRNSNSDDEGADEEEISGEDSETGKKYQIPMVALLISESPFTKSALLRAHSSPIPFFLLHLPPLSEAGSPDADMDAEAEGSSREVTKTKTKKHDSESDDNDNDNENGTVTPTKPLGTLGAAVCNPALVGAQGLLMGQLEVRWERSLVGEHQQQQAAGRPALWWNSERLPSFTRTPG